MQPIEEKISFNFLNIVVSGNYQKLKSLKEKYLSWSKALKEILSKNNFKYDPQKEYEKLLKLNINLILDFEDNYPNFLKEIPLSPFGLYYKGNIDLFKNKSISIVGTRKATEEGKFIAKDFAFKLAPYFNIVSGLALGIDSFAHLGALEANGKTIAVLANGLLKIYPKTNEKLGQKILENNGLIISEYNIYTPPLQHHFLERNRIISGISYGVLIVEAPLRSGALNTARFALEQNKLIWVIPGKINNPNYAGSNKLIQQGAMLVTDYKDILNELNIAPQNNENNLNLEGEEAMVYETLKKIKKPLDIDKLQEMTNLEIQKISRAISLLLIKEVIAENENGYYIIK
jgi:DNA processing protein